MITRAYKVLTHDLRPPIKGGDPVFDGRCPFALPPVMLDTTDEECGAGWNACLKATDALRIAGMWPNGRPSRLFVVETDDPIVTRGDKTRAATWTLVREETEGQIAEHVRAMSRPWFEDLTDEMTEEQMRWRAAFARPLRDVAAVEAGLVAALATRGLPWALRRFNTALDDRDAWDAWDTWDDRDTWLAWDAWNARHPRNARDAWNAWDARDARDARDALQIYYAARRGWTTNQNPMRLTTGLRDAYRHGLAIAVLAGPNELGWAMEGP